MRVGDAARVSIRLIRPGPALRHVFPWRKVALSTAAGIMLVAILFFFQFRDPMLLILGAIVAAMVSGFFGLAWLLVVGLKRTEK